LKKLTTTAYQRLAIRLRIAGLKADVHRISDEFFIKPTHNPKWALLTWELLALAILLGLLLEDQKLGVSCAYRGAAGPSGRRSQRPI